MTQKIYSVTVTKSWEEPVAAHSPEEARQWSEQNYRSFDSYYADVEVTVSPASEGEFTGDIPWNGDLGDEPCERYFEAAEGESGGPCKHTLPLDLEG